MIERRLLAVLALLLGTLALGACSTNPATGESMLSLMSARDEARVGREQHPEIIKQFGEYNDPRLAAYVTGVGRQLARSSEMPDLDWHFTVLDSPIVNAFALPGGYIYITRGLLALADNEAELASVLGHEIGHVTARHAAQRQSAALGAGILGLGVAILTGSSELGNLASTAGGAWVQSYSRDQEFQADELGIRYIGRNNYALQASPDFLAKMHDQSALEAAMMGQPGKVDEFNIMATHPRTIDRVQRAMREAGTGGGNRLERDAYLAAINGMPVEDNPREGYIRGRRFLHPDMGFAFEVPEGFRLFNRSDSVLAQHPSGALIKLDGARGGRGSMTDYLQNEWAARVRLQNVERLDINGFEAGTGTASGTLGGKAYDMRLIAIRYSGEQILRFQILTPRAQTDSFSTGLRQMTYSFRRLPAREAAALRPYRIRVVTVRAGDTVESLAARLPYPDYKVERFRVLNGLRSGERLQAGQKVKLIGE